MENTLQHAWIIFKAVCFGVYAWVALLFKITAAVTLAVIVYAAVISPPPAAEPGYGNIAVVDNATNVGKAALGFWAANQHWAVTNWGVLKIADSTTDTYIGVYGQWYALK